MRYRYWDACSFLGWLKQEADKVDECRSCIDWAEAGELTIVTSALTLAEVLYLKGGPKIEHEDRQKVRAFFENDYIDLYDLDRTVAERAQDVIWDHGIPYKDAIHVATALSLAQKVAIEQLDTFDGPLAAFSGKIGQPPLIIGRPNLPHRQEPLPLP